VTTSPTRRHKHDGDPGRVPVKTFNTRASVGGAVTGWICAAVGVAVALGGGAVFDWGSGTKTVIASLCGVIGCLLGGFRAGLLDRSAPLSNGAGAGALTSLALALIGLLQDPTRIGAVVFATLLGASIGTLGAMVSNVSANRIR
jgi:hypothetical protein